ncbi:MAG: hypothetical protein A2V98_13895 [Planctomycetes bacterium RBG_16_64_12]|nr:MAG: hypothetical protein A2V98_13895 [Planctomycetes bacterium RBG_16_64_12]
MFRRPIWMPPSWSSSASPNRLAEAMRWDRDTLWPKHNLPAGIPVAEVQGTMKPYDYQVLLWVAKRHSSSRDAASSTSPDLDAMNPKYLILRGEDRMPNMERIELARTEAAGLVDVSLWHNPGHLPRAWIVHRVEVLPPLASHDPRDVWRRTEQVYYPGGRPRDLRESAVVEAAVRLDGEQGPAGGEACRVSRCDPCRVEIEAELKQPGLVVLSDQFFPGWHLEVETPGQGSRQVPILRTNRMMRGAWLGAGRHRLIYRCRPASFLWGAWLSGVGWIALGAIALFGFRRRNIG